MKNKTQFQIRGIIVIGLSLSFFVLGCTPPQNNSGLSDKESRMSEELLRSQVLRYKAEAERDLSVMAKLFSQYAPVDSPYTPEISASISTAFAAMAEDRDTRNMIVDFGTNLDRYYLFYEKLKEKGGDMRGLKIDFETPIKEIYYSPPINEPQNPTSGTNIEASV
jgi:hypothetical protein